MKLKIIFTGLFTFLIFSFTIAQAKISDKLIGKWEGIDSLNVTGSLEFLDSINIVVTIPNQSLPPASYFIDTAKSPLWFDINFKTGNDVYKMKGLLEFIDEDTLKWQIFLNSERSSSFKDEKSENTIILKRNKPVQQ
jgi:hypothetical protein